MNILFLSITLLLSSCFYVPESTSAGNINRFADIDKYFGIISEKSIYRIDEKKLEKELLESIMRAAGDPYSQVTEKIGADEIYDGFSEHSGFGFDMDTAYFRGKNEFRVTNILKTGPAEAAGLRAGDIILQVNGIKVQANGKLYEGALELGEEGEPANFKINRLGEEKDISIKKAPYSEPCVSSEIIDGDVYYIDINYFDDKTCELLRKELTEADKYKFEKLIIDLRNNPGGDIEAAYNSAEMLIKSDILCYLKYKDETLTIRRKEPPVLAGCNIRILISENTASSAELFCDIIKNNANCKTVGRATFGKNTGQEFVDLGNYTVRLSSFKFRCKNEFEGTENRIFADIGVEEPLYTSSGDEILNVALKSYQDVR